VVPKQFYICIYLFYHFLSYTILGLYTDRCAVDRWLTGQSGAPPDSPVNLAVRRRPFYRERRLRRGRLIGQSGEL
jgi:hypothetical protein